LWQFRLVAALIGALMPAHAWDLVVDVPLGLLAYRLRSSWMILPRLALILSAGRSDLLAAFAHRPLPPPRVTGAVALTVARLAIGRLEADCKTHPTFPRWQPGASGHRP
jgi:hypothetical protein